MLDHNTIQNLDIYIDSIRDSLDTKREILRECIRLGEDAIRNAGFEEDVFSISAEIQLFIAMPLEVVLTEGFHFNILQSQDQELAVRARLLTLGNQLGISANLFRFDLFGKPSLWRDGEWIPHFSYEDSELEPCNCDECESRFGCEHYAQQVEEDDDEDHFFDDEDDYIFDDDLCEDVPPEALKILQAGGAASRFLDEWLFERDGDNSDWERALEDNGPLIDLQDQNDYLACLVNYKEDGDEML